MTTTLHGKSLIAGHLVEESGRKFRALSPLNSEPLEPAFHECTAPAVERALTLADEAFATYGRTTAEDRAVFPQSHR